MYKILIVEDNEDNLDVVESYLEDDFDLIASDNGVDGLELIETDNPDLVLLDISLPNMDGIEVIKRIRKKNKKLPVIALTAHAMIGDKEKFLMLGFDDYMSKPIVDDSELISMINNLLEKK